MVRLFVCRRLLISQILVQMKGYGYEYLFQMDRNVFFFLWDSFIILVA